MRREGRQHGMVRTHMILPSPYNPRPGSRSFTATDSPPTAGVFTKVPSRPTNHSKFTAKCGKGRCLDCHMHPVGKSKDKTKGTHKLKSNNLDLTRRLVSWRIVEGQPGLNFTGASATGLLDHIIDYDLEEEYSSEEEEEEEQQIEITHDDDFIVSDDITSFYDVGLVLSQVEGEEEWCLVGENLLV